MRYELRNGELGVFFSADELNVAVAYENSMHQGRGLSSTELIYACLVDSINEKRGVPGIDWRDAPREHRPQAVENAEGQVVVRTQSGEAVVAT